jgi:CRP-like cAMP-binding protein
VTAAKEHAVTEPFNATPLVRKLESQIVLSDAEKHALQSRSGTVKTLEADQDIVREGERPSTCCLVLDGFVHRYKMTETGKRQILSFHISGDIPDLQSLHLEVMDHSLGTLARSTLAFLPHDTVRDLIRRCPRIGDAFWRETLIDAAVFREWMLGLGRREAYGRMAHLLCELYVRLKAVGLANGHGYEMPLTQAELGDALGLSTVHVNRTLQDLRGEGLITLQGGSVAVLDWEGLRKAGEFDPTYLHLRKEAA